MAVWRLWQHFHYQFHANPGVQPMLKVRVASIFRENNVVIGKGTTMLNARGVALRAVCFAQTLALVAAGAVITTGPCAAGSESPGGPVAAVSLKAADNLPAAMSKVVFEVEGKLIAKPDPSSSDAPEHDLKALGNFLYEEQIVDFASRQAVRYYQQAESEISVDRKPHKIQLRADRLYTMLEPAKPDAEFRSLQGPLTRSELDLIEVPGGSHLVDQLLPGREVKIGETWTHSDELLAQFLNLDSVSVNDVKSELLSVEGGVAKLALSGKLMGSVAGVITELDLKAKYNFDVQQQRVVWLALGIGESRAAGLTQPGLRVQARIRMLIESGTTPHLAKESLEAVLASQGPRGDLLEYEPESRRFTLTHDRRWHLFSERPELTVMRFVENDQLVAQCNLRALSALPAGQTVSLVQFQQEIRKALGSSAQQIVDAQESTLPSGIRQLRVAVVGQVANTPIHWIYYQLNDAHQHRLTCVFTMSGEAVSRFGAEDLSMIGSLRMNDAKAAEVASAPEATRTE
jgi:hypothetical protein